MTIGAIYVGYLNNVFHTKDAYCIVSDHLHPYVNYEPGLSFGHIFSVVKDLYVEQSVFQYIEVFSTLYFGNILVIDGDLNVAERDEKHYHEMITHVALNYNYNENAKDVLIIGGGDGGTLFEALRHDNIISADLVDIDRSVIDTCIQFFPKIASSFSDERVAIHIEDGAAFVKNGILKEDGTKKLYDAILIDSTDFGQAMSLHTMEFYNDCKNLLKPGGIITRNVDNPFIAVPLIQEHSYNLTRIFRNVYYFTVNIPTFFTGDYAYVFLSDDIHPYQSKIKWSEWERKNLSTTYYNPEIHYASFLLPQYLKDVVAQSVSILELKKNIPQEGI